MYRCSSVAVRVLLQPWLNVVSLFKDGRSGDVPVHLSRGTCIKIWAALQANDARQFASICLHHNQGSRDNFQEFACMIIKDCASFIRSQLWNDISRVDHRQSNNTRKSSFYFWNHNFQSTNLNPIIDLFLKPLFWIQVEYTSSCRVVLPFEDWSSKQIFLIFSLPPFICRSKMDHRSKCVFPSFVAIRGSMKSRNRVYLPVKSEQQCPLNHPLICEVISNSHFPYHLEFSLSISTFDDDHIIALRNAVFSEVSSLGRWFLSASWCAVLCGR